MEMNVIRIRLIDDGWFMLMVFGWCKGSWQELVFIHVP